VKTWYDDQEVPERIEIRGVDYFRVAVKEDFVREDAASSGSRMGI
jgi:hypothetical protein